MDGETTRQRTFRLLADTLEYPQPGLVEAVRECVALLAADNRAAAAFLHEFGTFVEETPRGQLEEIYTATFDLNATCYPYVGYHLFGESYQRSVFMRELNKRYRAHGFAAGAAGELPDYLAVLLRFLAVCDDATLSEEIVHEALLPALERMDPCGDGATPPRTGARATPLQAMADERQERARRGYWPVLRALRLVLQRFPANTLPQKITPIKGSAPCIAKGGANAKQVSAKTQYSLQRIKAACKVIAKREASHRRAKKLWRAGCVR
jgi:nitrate reductase molybdenum cofactor assembly chaperone